MSPALEWLGAVLALAMVIANLRVHPVAWPLAIASAAIYLWVFAQSRLYGSAALQLLFIGLGFWGWWLWLRGRGDDGAPLAVRDLARRGAMRLLALTLLAWPAMALVMALGTDAAAPWVDAAVTAASVAGQWLLARKHVQAWWVWIGVNFVSVGLYASQGLVPTAALYALFLVLSVIGLQRWRALAASG